jgi:hypothetical protein
MTLGLDSSAPVARGSNPKTIPFDFKIAVTKRGDNISTCRRDMWRIGMASFEV